MALDIYRLLKKVREERPIVHHITNWVTIYDCANITKVFGASPVMAHSIDEAGDMTQIASSLVLNIGTLTVDLIKAMKISAKSANKKGIPVILDVCGAGATRLRDEKCLELLDESRISIIKGNPSEIARIKGEAVKTKGVDAGKVDKDMVYIALELAKDRDCTVIVTGKDDIITNGEKTILVKNGSDMMTNVVGTGCMAASVIGTFCAVDNDLVDAASAGLVCYEIASEIASKRSNGPGTFKENLFDAVFNLDETAIERMKKIECLKGITL